MEDLTGRIFGELTVISFKERKEQRYYWNCRCACGVLSSPTRSDLISGKSTSCGCKSKKALKESLTKHGQSKTRFYKIWVGMKRRCTDPNDINYKYYGLKGVTVCSDWLQSFETFEKDMFPTYAKNLTLDRKDGSLGYSKENCRWVDMSVQNYNKPISDRNTSGQVGVSFDTKCSKWRAYIGVNKRKISLGFFENFDCAVQARKQAEIKYYG